MLIPSHTNSPWQVLFYDDPEAVNKMPPMLGNLIKSFPDWGEHSNGIAQYTGKRERPLHKGARVSPFSLSPPHSLTQPRSQSGPRFVPKASAATCSTTRKASRRKLTRHGVCRPNGTCALSSSSVPPTARPAAGSRSSSPTSSHG